MSYQKPSSSRVNGAVLRKGLGGAIRRAAGQMAAAQEEPQQTSPPPSRGLRGALGRAAGQLAGRNQQSVPPRKRNHMVRNTGPIKAYETATAADQSINESGEGLRQLVGRMSKRGRVAAAKGGKIDSSGPKRRLGYRNARVDISVHDGKGNYEVASVPRKRAPQEASKRYRYAEGGKVGTAMNALRALAKKYQSALESGDTVLARRLKKQLDSAGVKDPEEEVGNQKAATFAKGGKVKGVKSLAKMFRARMDDREGYIREGKGATKEEAYKKLREEVARDNGEDTVDALLKEHGVTYRGRE